MSRVNANPRSIGHLLIRMFCAGGAEEIGRWFHPLVSTLLEPMFSRLRRPMCGRSLTFRKLGFISRGYAPHVVRRTRSKQTGNRRASKTVFAKYKCGGRSPIKRNALSEGRRPSAHRAAEPRRKILM